MVEAQSETNNSNDSGDNPSVTLENQGYIIRPETNNRFRPSRAREIIQDILKTSLADKKYDYDTVTSNAFLHHLCY